MTSLPVAQPQSSLRFMICALGICIFYWIYGMMQESILGKSSLGATFVLVGTGVGNVMVAHLWHTIEVVWYGQQREKPARSLNHAMLAVTSFLYVGAMVCSNEALKWISYPEAVLGKSMKQLPIMVVGTLVERRIYSRQEWFSAFLICTGMAMFQLSRIKRQEQGSSNDVEQTSWIGTALLLISLACDGLLGACQGILKRQDKTGKQRPPTAVETMFYINLYSLVFLIPRAILTGQWAQGIEILAQDRSLQLSFLVLNGVVGMGQICIFLMLTWYSALACTIVTTTRKFFTILLSVLYFGHKFTLAQWSSVIMVFGGLFLAAAAKKSPTPPQATSSAKKTQ